MNVSIHTMPIIWATYMIEGSVAKLAASEVAKCDAYCQRNGLGYATSYTPADGAEAATHGVFVCEQHGPSWSQFGTPKSVMAVADYTLALKAVADVQVSKAGRKLLRKELTALQAGLPKLPADIVASVDNAGTYRWPIAGLSADLLKAKAVALGVTDLVPYSTKAGRKPAKRKAAPAKRKATPAKRKAAPATPAVTPAPAPATPAVTPTQGGVTPTRMSANKAFGVKFKALNGINVDMWPVGHHPHVPAADPNMYMGYEDGKLLADILLTLNRVGQLPHPQQYLSNLWLKGHKGTGKSAMIKQVAATLRRPLRVISTRPTTTIAELLGEEDIRSVGKGEDADLWIDGLFTAAIKLPYAIVVLDEYTRGTQLGVSLNGPLMERQLQVLETGSEIAFAKGVNMVVTDNNGGMADDDGCYDGGDVDTSQLDRWPTQVDVDYLPKGKEVAVLSALTGIPQHTSDMIVTVAGCARAAAGTDMGDSRFRPSLRFMQSWALALMEGRDTERAFRQTMLIGLQPDTIEAALVILKDQVSPDHLKDALKAPKTPSPAAAVKAESDAAEDATASC
jgi:hypothetical protein